MTTNVTVFVNGQYQAEITMETAAPDGPKLTALGVVGPKETKTFSPWHGSRIIIEERPYQPVPDAVA